MRATPMTVPCFLHFSAALAGRERMGLGCEVLRFTGSGTPPERLRLPPQRRNFHSVQPLPDGALLLAGARRLGKPRAFRFQDEAGTPWKPTWMCGRGPWLYACEGTRLFRIHLDSLVASATHGH